MTILVVACALSATARAEIEFIGVLVMQGRASFALRDDPAKTAIWRTIGQEFAGYTLGAFDSTSDTLTLKKGEATLRLQIKEGEITRGRMEIAGALTIGTKEKFNVTRATLVLDRENVFPLKDGLTWRITPAVLPDGNLLYVLAIDRTLPDGKLERISAPNIRVLPGRPFSLKVGDLEFSFAPTSP